MLGEQTATASDRITVLSFGELPGGRIWQEVLARVSLWGGVKWMLVVGLVMYCAFALVIVKQVGIMAESYDAEANGVIKLFAWVHFAMALVLVGVAIIVL